MVQIVGKKYPLFEFKNESGDQIWSVDMSEDKIVFVGEFDRAAEDLFRAFWSRAMDAEKAISEAAALRRERDELAARLAEIEAQEPVGVVEAGEWRTGFSDTSPAVWVKITQDGAGASVPLGTVLHARPAPSAAPERADIVAAERERWKRIAENAQAVTTGGDDKGDYFEVPSHLIAALALALDEGLGAQGQAGAEAANPAGGCGACGDACRSRASCRLADESPRPAGWKAVPVDPTPEMIDAADSVDWRDDDTRGSVINMWHCMLAAAPDHLEDARGMVSDRAEPADLLRTVAQQILRDIEATGQLMEWSTPLAEALSAAPERAEPADGCSDRVSCPRGER